LSRPTRSSEEIVAEAEAEVETLTIDEARTAVADGALFVDIRDVRELRREGKIPGAYHAPRGMLEFWFDPDSPYHHEALSSADNVVLYCNLGWRSALAARALQDMGITGVSHLGVGFDGWRSAGEPIEEPKPR
jgi:rhodanese-related sulfurtransferase